MDRVKMTQEESYLRSIQGTLKIHRLDRERELDSPEADEIRDGLDPHWYNMTQDQKNSIGTISERLYQIAKPGRYWQSESRQEAGK